MIEQVVSRCSNTSLLAHINLLPLMAMFQVGANLLAELASLPTERIVSYANYQWLSKFCLEPTMIGWESRLLQINIHMS
jgi:hypothetical protein